MLVALAIEAERAAVTTVDAATPYPAETTFGVQGKPFRSYAKNRPWKFSNCHGSPAVAVSAAPALTFLVIPAVVAAVAVKLASPSVNAARITAIADQSAAPALVVESVIEVPLDQAESNINPELFAGAPPSEGCE
jgi:hypothetical protein